MVFPLRRIKETLPLLPLPTTYAAAAATTTTAGPTLTHTLALRGNARSPYQDIAGKHRRAHSTMGNGITPPEALRTECKNSACASAPHESNDHKAACLSPFLRLNSICSIRSGSGCLIFPLRPRAKPSPRRKLPFGSELLQPKLAGYLEIRCSFLGIRIIRILYFLRSAMVFRLSETPAMCSGMNEGRE